MVSKGIGNTGFRDKLPTYPWLISILLGAMGCSVLGILFYGFYTGDRMIRGYAPLVDAAMEIKLETTTAHLWFEEIMSGDRNEDMKSVWQHLNQADWYAKAMLEGGKNPEGTFIFLEDDEMRREILEVQGKISEFRDITLERLAAKKTSGVGTSIDQRYDAIFKNFIIQADDVESKIQQLMVRDIGRFRNTQIVLMVGCSLLFLAIVIIFHRYERNKAKSFTTIKETKNNLKMEIVERKRVEVELLQTNRALKMLSECTDAVARATDESHLLSEVCRIIVESGGYCLAWICFAEQDKSKTVRPVAQAGYEEGYLDTLNLTWADTDQGRGPTGTAIRTGKPSVILNLLTDPNYACWRAEATKRGYASSIALPLVSNDDVIGALNIYASSSDFFEAVEVKLLMELADNLVYGIMVQRSKSKRIKAEAELEKSHAHLEEQVEKRTEELKEKTDKIEESRRALTYLLEDVNESRQALEKLNADYGTANKELKEFAYIVSHDLKAPLRAISQLTHWISEDYTHLFDDDGKMQMGLIIKRVTRMDGLIDGILRYSRVGRTKEKEESLDLNIFVSDIIDNITLPENMRVIVENKLPVVLRDPTRMQQVFQNLIGNAVKFMDKDEGVIKIRCTDEGAFWKFSIADNGPGIDTRYHEKIFQIFQTLTSRDERESTGIGLTLVKKIITLYGGSVWVESEKDHGATFFFTLPKKGGHDEKIQINPAG